MANVVRDHHAGPVRNFPECLDFDAGSEKKNAAEEGDDPVIKNGMKCVTQPHSLGGQGEIFLLLGSDCSSEFI